MNFSRTQLIKELLDLPQELIGQILILIPTQVLISLCNCNEGLQCICCSSNFWCDKMENNYPEYKENLINGSHLNSLLALDRGREIRINLSSEYVKITINSTFSELVSHFKPRLLKFIAIQECYHHNKCINPNVNFYVTIIEDRVFINSPSIGWRTNFSSHTPLYSIKFFEDKRLYYELIHIYATK